jgi:uncharacterized membrane protein
MPIKFWLFAGFIGAVGIVRLVQIYPTLKIIQARRAEAFYGTASTPREAMAKFRAASETHARCRRGALTHYGV